MRLFSVVCAMTIITILFGSILNKIDVIEQQIEVIEQLQKELDTQEILYKDTIHCQQDYYRSILDSLPLGSPLDTLKVSSNYGSRKNKSTQKWEYHPGIDFIADWRDTVYATGHGIIEKSGYTSGYGRTITINHISGYKSRYAHLTRYFVKQGDLVNKGQAIGTAGNTGNSRGDHLHYEIMRAHQGFNKITDPVVYIKVKATMYHPVESQCDDDPLVTADGSIIDPYNVSNWNWIAVSQDMLEKNGGIFNYGDQVYISGTHKDGLYTIHDCMNRRKTNQIDFLENIGTKQYKYTDVELYAINN